MIALVRLFVVWFIVLTVIYFVVSLYSRSVRREKLEEEWAKSGRVGDREDFVARGMEDYDGSLRKKLIWGVYVVPTLGIIILIYVTNFM